MKFKKGDIVKFKYNYRELCEMYKEGNLKFKSRIFVSNDKHLFGIDWSNLNKVYDMKKYVMEMVGDDKIFINFYDSNDNYVYSYYIPIELIKKNSKIELNNKLFEI